MKDPAVLWYFNDWGGGTVGITRHQKGAYMDLLYAQFNLGDLSLDQIKNVLGSDFGPHWPALLKKFKHDEATGLYYNERLKQEREKRKSFTDSRRSNAKSQKHMHEHMENRNENRNVIKYGELRNVILSEEDFEKLKTSLGEKNTLILIGELDLYIAQKGKNPYKSHYAALLNWARRKVQNHIEKLPTKKIGSV